MLHLLCSHGKSALSAVPAGICLLASAATAAQKHLSRPSGPAPQWRAFHMTGAGAIRGGMSPPGVPGRWAAAAAGPRMRPSAGRPALYRESLLVSAQILSQLLDTVHCCCWPRRRLSHKAAPKRHDHDVRAAAGDACAVGAAAAAPESAARRGAGKASGCSRQAAAVYRRGKEIGETRYGFQAAGNS